MNLIIHNIKVPVEEDNPQAYLKDAARIMGVDPSEIALKTILSKDLDMRNLDQFQYKLSLVIAIHDQFRNRPNFAPYSEHHHHYVQIPPSKDRPIVVGFGPAGMFAALELIRHGLKPVIFERGKPIEERTVDVQQFIDTRQLNPESNIQFGEGGAGSYSDGKLFSRRHNNTSTINRVLKTFIEFGAPPEIGYISKPHLGTDVLCEIVRNIRYYILERGGEIHYNAAMTDLLVTGDRATGIVVNKSREYLSSSIFIALGHSARDTLAMLHARGVALEQKPISMGVRIEHPADTINLMRYGRKYQHFTPIGAATYSLNYTNRAIKRGVHTFCMCPGGEVVNASSEQGMLVVNGMSYSQRASPYSNAAMVVTCRPNDFRTDHPLAGLDFQRDIERKTYEAGGGNWQVPAQNLLDFLHNRDSTSIAPTSYKMGTTPANMRDIFPEFMITELLAAFGAWEQQVPLFISRDAILLGAETRTSSPVRMTRKPNFESAAISNLYPLGEGAGYTGGITSSAADAIRAVDAHVLQK